MTAPIEGPRADAQVTVIDPFEADPWWPGWGEDQVTAELARRDDPAAEVEWDPEPEYGPMGPGWRTAPQHDADEASI